MMRLFGKFGLSVVLLLATAAVFAQPAARPVAPVQTPSTVRPTIKWGTIKEALEKPLGEAVYVRATLVSFAAPRPESKQPYSLYISDESGLVRCVIFQDTFKEMEDTSFLKRGIKVDIYAKVSEYNRQRQLVIEKPRHIRRTPGVSATTVLPGEIAEEYVPMAIGAINIMAIGQSVRVRGVVTSYTPSSDARTPFRAILKDQSGEVQVIFWRPVHDQVSKEDRPVVGMPLQASGVVSEFQETLQVRIDDPKMISRRFDDAPSTVAAVERAGN